MIIEPSGITYELPAGGDLLVGSAAQCDIRIESAAPEHARITTLAVEALAECRVGGVRLRFGERRELAPDCAIEIGSVSIFLEDPEVSIRGMSTRSAGMQLARGAVAPSIFVVQGRDWGTSVELSRGSVCVVGRAEASSGFVLTDERVSRQHVEISWEEAGVLVRDLGSTGGTYLGRRRLEPLRRAIWPSGTMLQMGRTVLGLEVPPALRRQLARAIERAPLTDVAAGAAAVVAASDEPAEQEPSRSMTPKPDDPASVSVSAAGERASTTPAVDERSHAGIAAVDVTSRSPPARDLRRADLVIMIIRVILAVAALAVLAWAAGALLSAGELPDGELPAIPC